MAILYGSLERVKRNLNKKSDDFVDDTRLEQILKDTADYINLRLKDAGVADPAVSVATDDTIDRIASEIAAARFSMERHSGQREFSAAGQRGTERWNRLQFALQELQLWINITQTVGRVSTGTFRISKVKGEGLAGTAFPLDDF